MNILYVFIEKINNWYNLKVKNPAIKSQLGSYGNNVELGKNITIQGTENVHIGNNVSVGDKTLIMCTRAECRIGDDVMIAPNVTIVTGNHRIDIVGRTMKSITDDEKKEDNDQPVVLEGDNWIGVNATILKGVTIGVGAVVAAGAVVTHNVEPYSCVAGVPARKVSMRFTENDMQKHIKMIRESDV